ncbi:MAG: hypothetical protein H7Y18_07005 [Clostridiaceae bacterium]|nr:hypothetical protein [Clostridiaceae bacterium]
MVNLMLTICGLIAILVIIVIPMAILALNLYRLIYAFLRKGKEIKKILGIILDVYSTTVLPTLTVPSIFRLKSAREAIIIHNGVEPNIHATLAYEHMLTIIIILIFSIISFWVLKIFSSKLSPILYLMFSSGLLLEIVFIIFFFIQVKSRFNIEPVIIPVYGFANLLFLYLYLLKDKFDEFICREKELNRIYENKVMMKLYALLIKANTLPIIIMFSIFPILIILQLISIVFGQQPDSFIKVFVETSDWTFSKLKAPPPIYVPTIHGHYLCTVALKGHKSLVKPIRYGVRQDRIITVNRQLLVANAFENILEQYTPKFHRVIRKMYDKYGLPISKYINSALTADLIYIIMKPLEWIFLFCLYLIDKNPENRITVQYLSRDNQFTKVR